MRPLPPTLRAKLALGKTWRQDPSGNQGLSVNAGDDRSADERWARLRVLLAGRWTAPVLYHLAQGLTRPSELLRAINAGLGPGEDQLTNGVMFGVLSRLRDRSLLESSPVPGAMPPETHYRLTPGGDAIIQELAKLGSPGARPWSWPPPDDSDEAPREVDTTRPHPARVWDYWKGGKTHFAADREQASRSTAAMPYLPVAARMAGFWLADVTRRLAAAGVRQFLDLGTGVPFAGSVHEVAQAIAPESRVVYVDNDPIVLAHARALLASSPEGACAYLDADLRDPARILDGAARTLDLAQPTAIILCGVLHFITDDDDPWAIVATLVAGITGDAWLAVGHGSSDQAPAHTSAAQRAYNEHSPVPITFRPKAQVARFFAGMRVLEPPGLVAADEWPADGIAGLDAGGTGGYAWLGLGYRPGTGAAVAAGGDVNPR
jgi:DNA-binding HxlR family transcriptional regulator